MQAGFSCSHPQEDLPQITRICLIRGLIFYKLELQSHTAPGAVEEGPKPFAREIVLHITWIPMIRDVEDCEAGPTFVLLTTEANREALRNKQVETQKRRKASTFIAWTNKLLLLIQE